MKDEYRVRVIYRGEDLPAMPCRNFFHSRELFLIAEQTPRHTPYMVVAEDREGHPVAHLLAVVRRRTSWFLPFLYTQGRIYGEGEYEDATRKDTLFGLLLQQATTLFRQHRCFYVECSDISTKMFGYSQFRSNGYFPIRWQEVHNSLHHRPPEERLPQKTLDTIRSVAPGAITTREASTEQERHAFYRLLRNHFRMKLRRFIPPEQMFTLLSASRHARTFITLHQQKIIGGCVCAYSDTNAYLWYLATKRKTYRQLSPDTLTVWHAIRHAHEQGFSHISFMDVGLPYSKNKFRSFILSFGGKPVSKYRWFRFPFGWLNRLLSWFFQE